MAARAAFDTPAVRGQMPRGDVIPIAPDEHRAAAMTMGSLASGIVDIASVDIAKARFDRDFPCITQGQ